MNEKTIKQLQALPRVSIENGITYYIIPQEEYEKLKDKEQECEELTSQRDKFEFGNNILEHERNNYKHALDEIEYYINNQGINNKWNMRIQRFRMGILDIINKAKDGEQ